MIFDSLTSGVQLVTMLYTIANAPFFELYKEMEKKRGPSIAPMHVVLLRELEEVRTTGVPHGRFECDQRRTIDKDGEVS